MKQKFVFFFIFIFIGLSICVVGYFLLSETPEKKTLRVLTYSSFSGVYGPGRILKKRFELFCKCEVQWFLTEDSTALLQRFLIVPDIDMVIGWDQITGVSAQNEKWVDLSFLREDFIKTKTPDDFDAGLFFQNPYFLPIDWAPIGFLYKNENLNIKSLKSLYEIKGQISFPEPRTSSLGLQFYYWIYEVFKRDTKQISRFLKKLKKRIYGPVFSWSLAYGFFQKGQVSMSLSYLSSLLYHQKEEPEKSYFFSYFKEGQAYQAEYISVSLTAKNRQLALDFVKFLLSEEAQSLIQERHYMFSVSKSLPVHSLLKQKQLQLISYKWMDEFIKNKKSLLKLWEENLY